MDVFPLRPISIQAIQGSAKASQEQLAEARLFAAEVLQLGDGGSVILGVGRERIAATNLAGLQVGQRLLLKLRGTGTSRVIELVSQDPAEATAGIVVAEDGAGESHPFRLLAQGQGVGELLGDLAQALASRGESASAAARKLASELGRFAFPPGETGSELAQHIANSGLSHEARTLARSIESLPAAALASAADELIAAAFAALGEPEEIAPLRLALTEHLARLLDDPSAVERLLRSLPATGDRVGAALDQLLGRALEQSTGARVAASVQAEILERMLFARISPKLAAAVLRALLGERALLARALESDAPPGRENPAPDLKQWLSQAIDALEPGPERQAVTAALHSLEAEQFLALARASQGDGSNFAFALREGAAFSDARLVHRRLEEKDGGEANPKRPRGERAVLGFEFSRTGPVRADFGLDGATLHVRLGVSRSEVAEHLNARLGELRERLEASGRSVQITVGLRPADELRVPGPESDEHLADGRAAVDRFG